MIKLIQVLALLGYTLYTTFALSLLSKLLDKITYTEIIALVGWIFLSSVIIIYEILKYESKDNKDKK